MNLSFRLALPAFDCRLKRQGGQTYILDPIRKKYLRLTPEEWVRQHVLHYLIDHLAYPKGLCRLEQKIARAGHCFRPDILFCGTDGRTKLVVECKSPHLELSQDALGQLLQYNRHLDASVLVLTNGTSHFCWQFDRSLGQFVSRAEIPTYASFLQI